jgi:hypothetical protein
MSLINEALKKAQKLRTGDPTAVAPMPGGGARVTKRGEPRSTQQLVLIAAGALLLIVLSVVATFWFVNRVPAPVSPAKPVAVKPSDSSAPSPSIVPPTIKPPTVAETPAPKPGSPSGTTEQPAVSTASSAPATSNPPTPAPAPTTSPASTNVATTTPATEPPTTEPAASPSPTTMASNVPTDARVHAFVDTIKVMGIRSSGGDSRVLMNDRVFRVNDIVDRNLGVRLTKVAPDALTFTDSNGAVYVKNF